MAVYVNAREENQRELFVTLDTILSLYKVFEDKIIFEQMYREVVELN
ncbi:hypothetical protein [Dehalobacter sp.]|nr:hypothetical protein [Dehalobacter sp.]MDJ0306631.1 hypothetical protein [Dehalobacter sp.]